MRKLDPEVKKANERAQGKAWREAHKEELSAKGKAKTVAARAERDKIPKTCEYCGETFYGGRVDKKYCTKECGHKADYEKNFERYQQASRDRPPNPEYWKKYYAENTDVIKERAAQWDRDNPERIRERRLRNKYGIPLEEFDALLASQGGGCGICGKTEPGGFANQWHVDHDHETGEVRGLLCMTCNTGCGMFGDDPECMEKAIAYLRRSR